MASEKKCRSQGPPLGPALNIHRIELVPRARERKQNGSITASLAAFFTVVFRFNDFRRKSARAKRDVENFLAESVAHCRKQPQQERPNRNAEGMSVGKLEHRIGQCRKLDWQARRCEGRCRSN